MKKFPRMEVIERVASQMCAAADEDLDAVTAGSMSMDYGISTHVFDPDTRMQDRRPAAPVKEENPESPFRKILNKLKGDDPSPR
jgi:hypothetical protein